MPTAMEKLVSERDAISDTIERIKRKATDHNTNPIKRVTVESLISEIADAKIDIKSVHTRIRELMPKADEMDLHRTAYFDLADLSDQLNNFLHGILAAFPVTTPAPKVPVSTHSDMRLPKLELKPFDGNLHEWISFRDMFNSSVHKNTGLSKIQKMTYLLSLLKGEAARQIQSMILSDSNYDTAYQQLHDRYQNPREILFTVLHRFYGQQIQPGSSSSLRSLVDTTRETIRSMEILNLSSSKSSDAFLLYTVVTKLDQASRELWEQGLKGTTIPSLTDVYEFLEQRARALGVGTIQKSKDSHPKNRVDEQGKRVHTHHGQATKNCKICNDFKHPIFKCPQFHSMSILERSDASRRHNLCMNCLSEGHFASKCNSTGRCKSCNGKHHSLLHKPTATSGTESSDASPSQIVLGHHSMENLKASHGMLATAIIRVVGGDGQHNFCRALLDGGSTASFISESCCHRLGLRKTRNPAEVFGLAAVPVGTAKGATSVVFGPHFNSSNKYTVNALVLPKVTGKLPLEFCNRTNWSHTKGIILADPEFHKPASIDILLGSDVFWNLLEGGRRQGPSGSPIAISSTLGWLVAGKLDSKASVVTVNHVDYSLEDQVKRFWELESISNNRSQTLEEIQCEEFFESHHSRDSTGRFQVSLPFLSPMPELGSSREAALRRLHQLERRLSKQPHLQRQYVDFMTEYTDLGHMSVVSTSEVSNAGNPTYYIPHHFVLKEESTTTKLRVVFDASAKTTSGKSLNDCMLVGPTLQASLVDTVTRFRLNPVAFTADIAKMYRQIRVIRPDSDYQRILWRSSPSEDVKDYRLDTVTYGTASAPYLAVKVLQQLAKVESSSFPLASVVVLSDFYVDDLMSGSKTEEDAILLQSELLGLMESGGLSLRKWSSNSQLLLNSLPQELRASDSSLDIITDPLIKTLGIRWNTCDDQFEFRVSEQETKHLIYTKRNILSEISQLFDPLGWLSPIVVRAKILIQSLWKLHAGWDEELPKPILESWYQMKTDLHNIDKIKIPRCINPNSSIRFHLAGFCDASEKAYGGVVYLCSYYEGNCLVSLISSKTRVAPLKTVCLPRLELCGAVLLAELMDSVKGALQLEISETTAWTDSTIALAWIQAHPSKWKTFIANRVTTIQNLLPISSWKHVPGLENPADICSRGLSADELSSCSLWWNGPEWLRSSIDAEQPMDFQGSVADMEVIMEEERRIVVTHSTQVKNELELLSRYSSLKRLNRITALVLRFTYNCLHAKVKRTSPLTPLDMDYCMKIWIRNTQEDYFSKEILCLKNSKILPNKSPVLSLNPFLDPDGILRVGGRLQNAEISQDQKTPILVPRHSKFTDLLISSIHLDNHHAGPTLMLSILHQKYWILRARDAVRFAVRKCVVCVRNTATTQQQFMGNLPISRVTPCRAFKKCGLDYGGPFLIKSDFSRSKTTLKAYLCLFVCFSTRAFHLEVVSSLSSEAFLAALRRFVSRRGRPTDIFSDCGTNFVGANREMKEMLSLLQTDNHNNKMSNALANDGITWHFNPPGAPHFGGLWEAGIKSVKFHLTRIVGSTRLTFEELTTIVAQIEACLNSRPLTPLSSDPSDLTALTSGHFLIGEPLVSIPEPDLTSLKLNRLSRWQLIQSLQQQFWKRWSSEFLSRLQQRPKWLQQRRNLQVGDMVIIKDDNLSPQKWNLARIITLHPGSDGIVRVVTLRTATVNQQRPIAKLCLLPIFHEEDSAAESV